jgi:hypothetical protein
MFEDLKIEEIGDENHTNNFESADVEDEDDFNNT